MRWFCFVSLFCFILLSQSLVNCASISLGRTSALLSQGVLLKAVGRTLEEGEIIGPNEFMKRAAEEKLDLVPFCLSCGDPDFPEGFNEEGLQGALDRLDPYLSDDFIGSLAGSVADRAQALLGEARRIENLLSDECERNAIACFDAILSKPPVSAKLFLLNRSDALRLEATHNAFGFKGGES